MMYECRWCGWKYDPSLWKNGFTLVPAHSICSGLQAAPIISRQYQPPWLLEQADSYFGKKRSAAEVYGLDDYQYMRCEQCKEVWKYSFKLPLPFDFYISMLKKNCPKCGNDGNVICITMMLKEEGAKAMEELAAKRAKEHAENTKQPYSYTEMPEDIGRFAYLTLDDLKKSSLPLPTWLSEVSAMSHRLSVMEEELKANILLTGKPMVDAIVSRLTKLEGATEAIEKRIDGAMKSVNANCHAIDAQEKRIDKAFVEISALGPKAMASRWQRSDAIKCTVISYDSKVPDDGKGTALVRIAALPDSYTIQGDGTLTIRVPDYSLCQRVN